MEPYYVLRIVEYPRFLMTLLLISSLSFVTRKRLTILKQARQKGIEPILHNVATHCAFPQ